MRTIYDWLTRREGKLTAALVATSGVVQLATDANPEVMGGINIALAAWVLFLFGPADGAADGELDG